MTKALLIDVGGTNMRYAFALSSDKDISEINKIPFNPIEFEDFFFYIL